MFSRRCASLHTFAMTSVKGGGENLLTFWQNKRYSTRYSFHVFCGKEVESSERIEGGCAVCLRALFFVIVLLAFYHFFHYRHPSPILKPSKIPTASLRPSVVFFRRRHRHHHHCLHCHRFGAPRIISILMCVRWAVVRKRLRAREDCSSEIRPSVSTVRDDGRNRINAIHVSGGGDAAALQRKGLREINGGKLL